ncbi:hypothetical protein SBA1_820029 [Candidatus Sulfotelmatobacter kueseliae]|uniref:Uncharacterized protein n=1 Tax=Candidatus Sulfotelmatobacter kueseliae TaxID=2042962 RepID=A0A2U3L8J1_9BACT|nr:hypothetical protein SBA1_820029 [Candidatus Sulfotelmatobacter kueseliae]
MLDETGDVLLEQKLATTPKAMREVFGGNAAPGAWASAHWYPQHFALRRRRHVKGRLLGNRKSTQQALATSRNLHQPNYSEANFASSFSVPNTKSLFSFITLRKKWFTRLTGMSNVCVRWR